MTNDQIQSHIDFLLPRALQLSGNMEDARDLIQDVLLSALTAEEKGRPMQDPRSWLLTVLNRRFYDRLRRKYRLPTVSIDEQLELPDDSDDLSSPLLRSEQAEQVRREVAYLTEMYRTIIVRHHFHGESVESIAGSLGIPVGTVKSRLDFGRKKMKKGFETMENYTTNSYQPQKLGVSNSGVCGLNEEPMSLTVDDPLAQNLLILAYDKPVTVGELSRAIGVAAAYTEPVINRLVEGQLMKRTGDGKVYTDFIIYNYTDYTRYQPQQLEFAHAHADAYCLPAQKAIARLKDTDFYSPRLERYMLIHIAEAGLWNSQEGLRAPQICPERPNGGRWIAFGTILPPDHPAAEQDERYMISGQRCTHLPRYLEGENLEMYNYETALDPYGRRKHAGYGFNTFQELENQMLQLFYLIEKGIEPVSAGIDPRIVKSIPLLEERGFLSTADGQPRLLIPHLTRAQSRIFWQNCHIAVEEMARLLAEPLADYLRTHKKTIPPHLDSVPDAKLTMPFEPAAMMFVMEAIGRGIHDGTPGYPETFVVFD